MTRKNSNAVARWSETKERGSELLEQGEGTTKVFWVYFEEEQTRFATSF